MTGVPATSRHPEDPHRRRDARGDGETATVRVDGAFQVSLYFLDAPTISDAEASRLTPFDRPRILIELSVTRPAWPDKLPGFTPGQFFSTT
jgi:hypothetical protein